MVLFGYLSFVSLLVHGLRLRDDYLRSIDVSVVEILERLVSHLLSLESNEPEPPIVALSELNPRISDLS